MATPSLIIGGVEISIISMLNFDQQITPISSAKTRRMATGSAFKMSRWTRHKISLSASGWIPAPINSIDYSQPFVIELPIPEAFNVGDVLPAGWSPREAPYGEYSTTDQAGKTVRMVYLKMTVFSDGPTKRNSNAADPSWELVCEVA